MSTIVQKLKFNNDIKTDLSSLLDVYNVIIPHKYKDYPDKFEHLITDSFTRISVDIPYDGYELSIGSTNSQMTTIFKQDNSFYNKCNIYWGDGKKNTVNEQISSIVHIYENPGKYVIKLQNALSNLVFNTQPIFGYHNAAKNTSISCIYGISYAENLKNRVKKLYSYEFAGTQISSLDFLNNISVDQTNLLPTNQSAQFMNCYNISYVSSDMKITSTNQSMFHGCSSLVSVYLPQVTVIPSNTFIGCINLEHLYIPKVSQLGVYSFGTTTDKLPKIKELNLSGMIRLTSNYSICGMPNLTSLNLDNLSAMDNGSNSSFIWDLYSLQELNLPKCEIMRSGSAGCIHGMSSLRRIYLPKLRLIDSPYCFVSSRDGFILDFSENDNLVQLTNEKVFYKDSRYTTKYENVKILVKPELLDAYKEDTNWQVALYDYETQIVTSI